MAKKSVSIEPTVPVVGQPYGGYVRRPSREEKQYADSGNDWDSDDDPDYGNNLVFRTVIVERNERGEIPD